MNKIEGEGARGMSVEKQIRDRSKVDSSHERTEARIAFEAWRDANYPPAKRWWDGWDYTVIDSYWEHFLNGWRCGKSYYSNTEK